MTSPDTDLEAHDEPTGPRTPAGESGGAEAVRPLAGSDIETLLAAAYHEAFHPEPHEECFFGNQVTAEQLATPSGQALLATYDCAVEEAEMRGATVERLLAKVAALEAVFEVALAYVMDDTVSRADAEERLFAVMDPYARAALAGEA